MCGIFLFSCAQKCEKMWRTIFPIKIIVDTVVKLVYHDVSYILERAYVGGLDFQIFTVQHS